MSEEKKKEAKNTLLSTVDQIYGLALKYGRIGDAIRMIVNLTYYFSVEAPEYKDMFKETYTTILKDMLDMYKYKKYMIVRDLDYRFEKELKSSGGPAIAPLVPELMEIKYRIQPPYIPEKLEEKHKRLRELIESM